MKYLARELLNGLDNLDNVRELELRDCKSSLEAAQFAEEITKQGYKLLMKRQKKDYDKIMMVELYYEKEKQKKGGRIIK